MAHKVSLKRMFRDPHRPQSHTYYLFHKDGRNEHLCNLTHEYNAYHKRRMWWLDAIVGPSDNYPTKAEAIFDAVKYFSRNPEDGGDLAQEYLNERSIVLSSPRNFVG